MRSHKKFGPDRFSRFDVYWIQTNKQTNKQTNRQAKFIYRQHSSIVLILLRSTAVSCCWFHCCILLLDINKTAFLFGDDVNRPLPGKSQYKGLVTVPAWMFNSTNTYKYNIVPVVSTGLFVHDELTNCTDISLHQLQNVQFQGIQYTAYSIKPFETTSTM